MVAPADAGDLSKSGDDVVSWDGVSAAEVEGWPRTGRGV